MSINVRPYQDTDLKQVWQLTHQLGYTATLSDLAAELSQHAGNYHMWVALDGESPVGFVSTSLPIPMLVDGGLLLKVTALCVDRRMRRSGIGRALLNRVKAYAAQSAVSTIELSSAKHAQRAAAHAFYPHYGFYDASNESVVYRMKVTS